MNEQAAGWSMSRRRFLAQTAVPVAAAIAWPWMSALSQAADPSTLPVMLPISVATWCYLKPPLTPEAYYARLHEIGIDMIEMPDAPHAAAIKAAGLCVLNFGGPGDLNRRDAHAGAMEKLERALDAASELGAAQVLVFSGNRVKDQPEATGRENVTRFLEAAAPLAEKYHITLTLEVFNTFDHPGYEADSSRYAFDAIAPVDSPNVKVLYDIYHMHRMKEDVATVIEQNISRIAHLHVAGSPKRDFPSAEQAIDYHDVVQRTMIAGYRGYWGLEFLPTGDTFDEIAKAAKLLREYGRARS